ncbi:TPA: tail fiber assembly protein [Citrobacter freundii]|nr:tail fiber assembly protein [Citrobacter freundii]
MMNAKFDDDGFCIQAGMITVNHYDPVTRLFTGQSSEYIPEGVSLPAFAVPDSPLEEKEGYAIVWNSADKEWRYVEDYRGETVWNTTSRATSVIVLPGAIADGYTRLSPLTIYDEWDGSKWVTNITEQKNALITEAREKKAALVKQAADEISWRQDAVNLTEATEDEISALKKWQLYRIELNRVDLTSQSILWPSIPDGDV